MTREGSNRIIRKSTLYKGQANLGNGSYTVEMLLTLNDDMAILA